MRKDVFIDRHEQSNIVEDCKNFLRKIKKLELYIIEFGENGLMKDKIYSSNYIVHNNDCRSIIVITYDECTFSANDGI